MSSPGKQRARGQVTFSPTPTMHAYPATGGIPSVRSYAPSPLRLEDLSNGGPGPSTLAKQAQRGILKANGGEIRLASSVDEGTRGNQEEARFRLGKRPELKATDSFQLLADKFAESSDPTEPEETSSTASLVGIILQGADDLLTLEEAYNMLAFRFRQFASTEVDPDILEPIVSNVPDFVRAVRRDVSRLVQPVGSSDSERSSSPRPSSPCEERPKRQGYTEHEVRFRREASGVGHAALRWLAFMLFFEPLYSAFSIADLSSLLDVVLVIPFTPKIPTPNAKRTYALAIYVLSHIHIPVAAVIPVRMRVVEALREAIGEGSISKWGGGPAQDRNAGGNVKARLEGFNAINNILTVYPAVFVPHHRELLPMVLKGLTNNNPVTRQRAQSAAGAFVAARLAWLDSTAAHIKAVHKELAIEAATEQAVAAAIADWELARKISTEMPACTLAFLRRSKAGAVPNSTRETEYAKIDKELKAQMSGTDSKWACATWATLVSLLGDKYVKADMYKEINHIMKVTITSKQKPARLIFARLAWEHAIHAYFQYGSTATLESVAGTVVTRFDLDAMLAPTRVASILSPVTDALKSLGEAEGEAAQTWATTLATQTAAVIYAYSGILPGAELPRYDQCFDSVVNFAIGGLLEGNDELKLHAWEILGAITSSTTIPWSIDRLLCNRYVDGSVANADNTRDLELAQATKDEGIAPSEIPGWGSTWIATRLSRNLMPCFQLALSSVAGMQDVELTSWVRSVDGHRILPRMLSDLWRNLLKALMVSRISATSPSPVFVQGMKEVTRCIIDSFARNPAEYLPSALVTDSLLIRIGLAQHLFNIAYEECGDALALTRIDIVSMYGADRVDLSSPAGCLLDRFLHLEVPPAALAPYTDLLKSTLQAGAQGPQATKLLGDLTNRLPWLGQTEMEQLAIWRLLASQWCDHLATITEVGPSRTNHTGLMLVNLLSTPFRDRAVTSQWHSSPSEEDLFVWSRLLHATVVRSRAKEHGANGGVLEPLAAHLQDWQDDFEGTSVSKATVSCLVECVKRVEFALQRSSNPSPWAIDDSFVPNDFFRLVCASLGGGDLVLLGAVDGMLAALPAPFVPDVIQSFREVLAECLAVDEGDDDARSTTIDSLYITLLGAIQRGVQGKAIRATTVSLVQLEPLWSARLLSAKTPAVLAAFQSFWQATFGVAEVQYPDSTGHFLRQVIKAAPEGWIQAPGLAMESLQESVPVPVSELEVIPEMEATPVLKLTPELDAEPEAEAELEFEPVLQSQTAPEPETSVLLETSSTDASADVDGVADSLPEQSLTSTSTSSASTSPASSDVFKSKAAPTRRRKRPSSQPAIKPTVKKWHATAEDDTDEDIGECIVVEPSTTPSLFGRVISSFNSLPNLFSPRRKNIESQSPPAAQSNSQNRRKRRKRSTPAGSPAPSGSRQDLASDGPRTRRRTPAVTGVLVPETGRKRKRGDDDEDDEAEPTPLANRRQVPAIEVSVMPSPVKRTKTQQAFLESLGEAERLVSLAASSLDTGGLLTALHSLEGMLAVVKDGMGARTKLAKEVKRRRGTKG